MEDKVGDKTAEVIMMKEVEVTAAVASGGAKETAEDYDLDTNASRACSRRAQAHS